MRLILFLFLVSPLVLTGQESGFAWQDFSIGSPVMTLQMPGRPLPQSVNLPESVQIYVKRYDGFFFKDDTKGLLVTLSHVTYAGEIIANAEGAAEGTIDQWLKTGAKVEIKSTEQKSISGKPALVQKGMYYQVNVKKEFMDVIITENEKMWQLIVLANANDKNLQQAMQTMLNSISFKAN